jgi:AraC-like DNA-binding protein
VESEAMTQEIDIKTSYRSSHGLVKVETICREWGGVSVTYNAKYPGPGVAWIDLSSDKTTVVVCLEQKGGMCEPRLKLDQATPRSRYDIGYFIWVPANHTVWGYADSVKFVRGITLKFDLDHLMKLLGDDHDYSNVHKPLLMVYDTKVTQFAHLLANACVDPFDNDRVFGESLITAMLSAVVHASAKGSSDKFAGGLAPWQLRAAKEHLEVNFAREISLAELAKITRLSESRFARAFKASTGIPPYTWLLQRRIHRAQELLKDTDLAISNIAIQIGFADQSHFTKAFRRITGTTPRDWRQANQQ